MSSIGVVLRVGDSGPLSGGGVGGLGVVPLIEASGRSRCSVYGFPVDAVIFYQYIEKIVD